MDLTAHERKFRHFAHNPGLRTPFDNAVVSYDVFVSVGFERPVRFDDRGLVRVSVNLVAQLGWKAEKRRLLLIALRTRVISSCVKGSGLMSTYIESRSPMLTDMVEIVKSWWSQNCVV